MIKSREITALKHALIKRAIFLRDDVKRREDWLLVMEHIRKCGECKEAFKCLLSNLVLRAVQEPSHPTLDEITAYAVRKRGLANELNAGDRWEIEIHLSICCLCRDLSKREQRMQDDLADLSQEIDALDVLSLGEKFALLG